MRGTGEGSSSQTQAWAVECSALAKAVTLTGRSSADRVFRKITACKILSFSHTSLKEKKKIIGPNDDSFSFRYISSFPPASSIQIYSHLHIPFIFPSVIFIFFLLLCLNMFKQHSKWGTAAFAADAGPEGESINCSIAVLTSSSVLYLCSSWTIQYLPCYLFFLCHLKVKIGKLHSMSCDYTTNVSNCCCLLCLLQLNYLKPDFYYLWWELAN